MSIAYRLSQTPGCWKWQVRFLSIGANKSDGRISTRKAWHDDDFISFLIDKNQIFGLRRAEGGARSFPHRRAIFRQALHSSSLLSGHVQFSRNPTLALECHIKYRRLCCRPWRPGYPSPPNIRASHPRPKMSLPFGTQL